MGIRIKGLSHGLSAQPGVMQSSAALVFRQDQTVGSCLGAFALLDGRSQPNAEALGFNLNIAFHEHDLEGPALQPTQTEGIGQRIPLSASGSPYGAKENLQGLIVSESIQGASVRGFLALQTRVMKWVSAVIASKPAFLRRASMSSPM